MSQNVDIQAAGQPLMAQPTEKTENIPSPDTTPVEQTEAHGSQDAQQQQQAHRTPSPVSKGEPTKKRGRIRETINSPWILLTAPLLAGCIWLVNNAWMVTNNLDKPYALLAGPALVASVIAGWLVIKFFTTIAAWCKAAWRAFQRARKEDGSAQFFWIVIVVFMIVSVCASGSFFSMLEHDALPGLGYATALFIDLVAVQAMRARLNAVRMRNKPLARLYLAGVLLCSGASAFANVYISLADFHQNVTGKLPPWMLSIAPWFGLVFPAIIILLSITADATIDQISTRLDPEAYREQQAKQTKMLEYQRNALRDQLSYEKEIEALSAERQNRKERRVFFLYDWLFPIRKNNQPNIDTQKIIAETLEQMRPWFQFFDQKFGQSLLAWQTTQGNAVQDLQKNIGTTDADLQLVISEFLNFKQTMEQKENISSSSSLATKNTREEKEIFSASPKRRKNSSKNPPAKEQLSQKFLNFKPNAFHQKAVEFLRYLPEIDSISDAIRKHPSRGYEELAALFRQQPELNFAFVTEQFAAEAWSLFFIEREKQDGDEEIQTEKIEAVATGSPSPTSEKRDPKPSKTGENNRSG